MVKTYLRYEPGAVFGVVTSLDSNICYNKSGKLLFTAALEKLAVWNVKQGECVKALVPPPPPSSYSSKTPALTSIAHSPSSDSKVAGGYADGSIRIWDIIEGTCETTLNGHKGAVSALRYNKMASLLASGSKDNDIILWDVVGEAGLFRLRGHRDQVTDIVFLDSGKKLVSCSKDKFARVWDLETQHCMQIIAGHHSEIWSIDVDKEETYLVTGSSDMELRFYKVQRELHENPSSDSISLSDSRENKWEILKQFGGIQRQSKDRVVTVRFNDAGDILACQVAGKTVEIFQVLDEVNANRKAKRRIQRKREKSLSKGNSEATDSGCEINNPAVIVSDVFKLLQVLRASKKICSVSFCPLPPKDDAVATIALSLNNNMLEIYSVKRNNTATKIHIIDRPGHRSDIRSVALSSDSSLLMSTSHNAVKIWNPSNGSCIRTVESGYGLCCSFVPGNRYALVGTKNGTLEIIDVGGGTCIEMIEAHGGSIRSIVLTPGESGFVTGSADRDVKFWEYQVIEKPEHDSKKLTVKNVRTLKMNEDVLAVAVSPDGKRIAVSLLDSTIKVFFMDSLKISLNLYGHKLPVLCMDISSDGDLLVSGSADKNLKIWGLDFGDCHKSLFAHADSVMAVQFVHRTHYMFSVGKDRLVKYWDADKFELLLTLDGHHAEVWCLSISNRGNFIITGSHDRSIRRWDRTEEQFFIEEEREKRLDEMFESLDDFSDARYAPREELPEEGAVGLAGKQTQETLTALELITEALDMAEAETQRIYQQKEERGSGKVTELQPNPLMLGLSPSDYVLRALANVQANDLEQTLLSLPFTDALKLMSYLKDWSHNPVKVELVCRIATVLLQIHHNQLVATPSARPVLTILQEILYQKVKECKDTLGFNLAAMDHLKQLLSMKSDAPFRDAKAKLLEIRTRLSKQSAGKAEFKEEKRKRKRSSSRTRAGA